ncbi:MAG: MarR family winged helix-turn-helix transcriptional regulator [Thermomicrobiales bacterium]
MTTAEVDETQARRAPLAGASMDELVRYWNKLIWWTGIRPVFRRMVEIDLTLAESVVLRSLQHRPLTVSEVADCLYISHSAASRAVDRLVRDGFMSRQENPDDRRQKQLTLTPEGSQLVSEMEGIFASRLTPLIDALDADEQAQLRRLLIRMIEAHAALPDPDDPRGASCPLATRE